MHRNGSKRAVIATNSTTVERALRWAIEHSSDADFEHPVAQAVAGALLSESPKPLIRAEEVTKALLVLDDTKRSFLARSGTGIVGGEVVRSPVRCAFVDAAPPGE